MTANIGPGRIAGIMTRRSPDRWSIGLVSVRETFHVDLDFHEVDDAALPAASAAT
jgi:hypothetical protein